MEDDGDEAKDGDEPDLLVTNTMELKVGSHLRKHSRKLDPAHLRGLLIGDVSTPATAASPIG